MMFHEHGKELKKLYQSENTLSQAIKTKFRLGLNKNFETIWTFKRGLETCWQWKTLFIVTPQTSVEISCWTRPRKEQVHFNSFFTYELANKSNNSAEVTQLCSPELRLGRLLWKHNFLNAQVVNYDGYITCSTHSYRL